MLLAVLGVGAYALREFLKGPGIVACVQVGTEVIAELDLSEDTELRVGGEKDYNLIRVEDGAVYVAEADCADHICVKTGRIRESGEVIACLPHSLVIYIVESQ